MTTPKYSCIFTVIAIMHRYFAEVPKPFGTFTTVSASTSNEIEALQSLLTGTVSQPTVDAVQDQRRTAVDAIAFVPRPDSPTIPEEVVDRDVSHT